jgi:cell division protein FtsB
MTRTITLASLVAVALSLSLTACKDTKTLQENEKLKAQVADLQRENGQLGNNIETLTASRDELAKQNEQLKAQAAPRRTRRPPKKVSARRRRHR